MIKILLIWGVNALCGAAIIWLFVYRMKERERGRLAYQEWRKINSVDPVGYWHRYPLELLWNKSLFFQAGVIRAHRDHAAKTMGRLRLLRGKDDN